MTKRFCSVISVLLIAALCLTFCACQHTHTFSDRFSYDDEYHFRKATCEHTDEVADKAPHNIVNGKCAVCGYTPHVHTYSKLWTVDGEWHYRAATCGHTDEVADKGKHTYVDFVCTVCGAEQPATGIFADAARKLAEYDCALTAADVTLRTDTGEARFDNFQTQFKVDADGNLTLQGYGELLNGNETVQTVKFVSKQGFVYGIIDKNGQKSNVRWTTDEFLGKIGVDAEQINGMADKLNAQSQSVAQIALFMRDNAGSLLPELQEGEHTFDFDLLRSLNQTLYAVTVCQAVDKAAGRDGFYNGIPQLYADLLLLSVGEALDELAGYGLTTDKIVEIADYAVKNLTDGKYNSIDEFLYQQGVFLTPDMTLKQFLSSKAVRMMPFSEVLDGVLKQIPVAEGEQPLTAKALGELLEHYVVTYRDQTAYGILAQSLNGLTADEINQIVAYAVDVMSARMTFSVTVGADKTVTKLTVTCSDTPVAPMQSPDDTQAVAEAKAAIDRLFGAFSGRVELNVGFRSTVDYSDVLELVAA